MKSLFSIFFVIVFIASSAICLPSSEDDVWGFWAHRRINRLAVFTLPQEMIGFYKKHIEYITEHAVDPDKRRYASKFEGMRHFIDIDHWGTYPFPEVPRDWDKALMKYTVVKVVNQAGDTLEVLGNEVIQNQETRMIYKGTDVRVEQLFQPPLARRDYQNFFREFILPQYYEDSWRLSCDTLQIQFGSKLDCQSVIVKDEFSEYGTAPYNHLQMQNRLTRAFRAKDEAAILRLSAEMGHYIGDAHVPLHTTENYNGQLTDQVGIHAFWESRIPELFADDQYDYFVGTAQYLDNPKLYFWDAILESHQLLDSVLIIEKELSQRFPEDQQFCYEERLGRTIRTQCKEYAMAYQSRLNGMIEDRMQDAILSIGSAWFTAWIDAGQPDLRSIGTNTDVIVKKEEQLMKELNDAFKGGTIKGREHN
ncbi:MAG: zinc dependent phospholipase C family protein [Bacteroidota bacterium]